MFRTLAERKTSSSKWEAQCNFIESHPLQYHSFEILNSQIIKTLREQNKKWDSLSKIFFKITDQANLLKMISIVSLTLFRVGVVNMPSANRNCQISHNSKQLVVAKIGLVYFLPALKTFVFNRICISLLVSLSLSPNLSFSWG